VSLPCGYLAVMNLPPLPPPPTVAPAVPALPVEDRDEVRVTELAAVVASVTRQLAAVDPGQVGDGELLALVEALAPVIDRLTAVQAVAVGQVDARGAAITREGLLTEAWLQLVSRRAGGDRRTLLVAGDVLPSLPKGAGGGVGGTAVVVRGPGDLPEGRAAVAGRPGAAGRAGRG
jgi:hypothetical protein